ncbi:outer membrane beta-barrel protein [Hymenobacter saemangeumensis]|uniref:Outer membrane beta-barrel protein n=1 Tax=Hymenobacter saemangeumensis TaxID=1084522 RepID=A0ABP8IHE6_9BACT
MVQTTFLFTLLFLSTIPAAWAQAPTSVSGRVTDGKDQSPLIGANVLLIHLPDSVKAGAAADAEGRFRFDNVAAGRYVLDISFVGYRSQRQPLAVGGAPVQLGTVAMQAGGVQLKGVTVLGQAAQSVQKGDTTQFNARAFKTNPDANASDLITKMPGVTVGADGKVQAQGENVQQVLVDGKPFFGSDPDAVLKNLPAEVIDKIEVFDQRSEQSRFSGFDDGNTTKTINIVTKPAYRKGTFGRVVAGAGPERYRASGNINTFDGERRMSLLAQSNNVNEQNFGTEDLLGVVGGSNQGGGGRGGQRGGGGPRGGGQGGPGGGGGGASDFLVNQSGGITKTNAIGANYSNTWNKKTEATASYFFNRADNTVASSTRRQYADEARTIYNQEGSTGSLNTNHRFNLRLEHKLDSMNSILFRPRLSYQLNEGASDLTGLTLRAEQLQSNISSAYRSSFRGLSSDNDLLLRHRFAKPGRTISLGVGGGYSQKDGTNNLSTLNSAAGASNLNQRSTLRQEGGSLTGSLAYAEPLTRQDVLQASYNASYAPNNSNKRTFDYDEATADYVNLNRALSNVFENYYLTQAGGLSYRHITPKYQAMVGASVQHSVLHSDAEFPMPGQARFTFLNVLPTAMLNYRFSKQHNLRAFYRTSTNPPSIGQLQAVVNNANPLQLTIGNPTLQQELRHNFIVRYTGSNPEKASNFFAFIGGSYTQDAISNNTFVAGPRGAAVTPAGSSEVVELPAGGQLSQPVNLSQQYTLRSLLTYGRPIKPIKTNLNFNLSANYSQVPGLVNNSLNYARTPSFGAGLVLSSNISERLDFTLSSTSTQNLVRNTLQAQLDNNYFAQVTRFRLNWIVGPGISIQTDLAHQAYSGLSAGFNQQFLLWNGSIGKKLFPGQRGEIKLYAFDILGQNQSIQRNVTEAYFEDVQTNILQRYLMLMFTYNIRSGNAVPAEAPADGPDGPRDGGWRGRPGGQ